MAAQIGSFNGIIEVDTAVIVASLDLATDLLLIDISTIAIRKIVLYNPNIEDVLFQIRKRIKDDNGENGERFLVREDDKITTLKPWKFGEFGGFWSLDNADHYYDVILDIEPTLPIQFIIDYGYSL